MHLASSRRAPHKHLTNSFTTLYNPPLNMNHQPKKLHCQIQQYWTRASALNMIHDTLKNSIRQIKSSKKGGDFKCSAGLCNLSYHSCTAPADRCCLPHLCAHLRFWQVFVYSRLLSLRSLRAKHTRTHTRVKLHSHLYCSEALCGSLMMSVYNEED